MWAVRVEGEGQIWIMQGKELCLTVQLAHSLQSKSSLEKQTLEVRVLNEILIIQL